MKADKVSWMSPAEERRSTAITGSAGRYMSIDRGVKDDRSASTARSSGVRVGRVGVFMARWLYRHPWPAAML
jgi:hypothetical protein